MDFIGKTKEDRCRMAAKMGQYGAKVNMEGIAIRTPLVPKNMRSGWMLFISISVRPHRSQVCRIAILTLNALSEDYEEQLAIGVVFKNICTRVAA